MLKMTGAAAAAVAFAAAPAAAEPVEIKFASPSPPKAHLNVQVYGPWSKEVSAASGGTLEVKLVAGPVLANHRNIYDRIRKGVAAIGWGLQSAVAGQFPGSSVVGLPTNFDTSQEGSIALWRLYEKGLLDKEYGDIHPLAIFSFPPTSVHANVPITGLDDLQGMKLAATGKIRSRIAEALGAVPITLVPPQMYQSISRGLVKGAVITWTAFQPYRLHEVTNHHIDVPISGSAGMIIMNKKAYARLPAKARAAIDAKSGEVLVRRFSAFWDRILERDRNWVRGMKGHTITALDAAEKARWMARLLPVNDLWVKETPNGAKLLETFRAEIARFRATN